MLKRWFKIVRRPRRPVSKAKRSHYLEHKEKARELVLARLEYFNQYYQYKIGGVRIKAHSRRWGSCSAKGNLNFNYKILFLPIELQDYIVVHELCHLGQLNHSSAFWNLVAEKLPNYPTLVNSLRKYRS